MKPTLSRVVALIAGAATFSAPFHGADAGPARKVPPALRLLERAPGAGAHGLLAGRGSVPIVIELERTPDAVLTGAIERAGASIVRDDEGRILRRGRRVFADLERGRASGLAAVPGVAALRVDAPPLPIVRPLDLTAELIAADAVWRTKDDGGLPVTGAGITVCDVDSGIDPRHPMFFRADGGYFGWVDTNDSGRLELGTDTVDLGQGPVVLRSLNGVVANYWDESPRFGTEAQAFDPSLDYLYADENGNGVRDSGTNAGFTEATPGYGERLFLMDDVDGDGALDLDEKLVALGTSKIKAFKHGSKVYRRGKSLIDAPWDESMQHGNGASGVMVGGQPGLSVHVGMAPDADVVMATDTQGYRFEQMTAFCLDEGARVVLHEYAPWVGYHLDGSSPMEQLIDESSADGVVHVNPAGNLSSSDKLMKRSLAAGGTTELAVQVPPIGATVMVFTLLWRDPTRALDLRLRGPAPDLTTVALPAVEGTELMVPFGADAMLYAYRDDSARGTAMVTFYVYATSPATVTSGDWALVATDAAPPAAGPVELIAFVMDEISGWGSGIRFSTDVSEDHLIGFPGTADKGLAVAAFTGHDFDGGETGERAGYSGRGHRIDGVPILWISAPDNPIVPATFFGTYDLGYTVYGGTSGASPHVAGAAALVLQAHPELDGEGVKAAIREGAAVDRFTGAVPNDDYGHGKLDAYRAVNGAAAPGGGAPRIEPAAVTIETGPQAIELTATDPDGDALVFDVDRDYDGTYEERLAGPRVEVNYAETGSYVLKVRATDPTGREGRSLVHASVSEKGPDDDLVIVPTGGGGCAVRGAGGDAEGRAFVTWLLAAAVAARLRRKR